MADNHPHLGGFAHYAQPGFDGEGRNILDQAADADAADFFVIGEGEVNGHGQGGGAEFGGKGQTNGDERLHVGGTAPI